MRVANAVIIRVGAGLLLFLLVAATPLVAGFMTDDWRASWSDLSYLGVFLHGFVSLGWAGMIVLPVLFGFAYWLIFVGPDWDPRSARSRRQRRIETAAEVGNSALLMLGGCGLALGLVSGIYAAVAAFAPYVLVGPRLPLNFVLAGISFVLGGGVYALGRYIR